MNDSPFQKLSPELRNMIWQLAVKAPGREVSIGCDAPVQQPSITQACRQIRTESLLMFYSENEFYAHGSTHLTHGDPAAFMKALKIAARWLRQTPASCRSQATVKLTIHCVLVEYFVTEDLGMWKPLFDLFAGAVDPFGQGQLKIHFSVPRDGAGDALQKSQHFLGELERWFVEKYGLEVVVQWRLT